MAHKEEEAIFKHILLFGWFCSSIPVVLLGDSLVLHLPPYLNWSPKGDSDMIAIPHKDGVHPWFCIEWRCEESSCSHVFLGDGELPELNAPQA